MVPLPSGYKFHLFSQSGYGDGVAGVYPEHVTPTGTNWASALSWDKHGKITNVDTKPRHQGRGLATSLFHHVRENYRDDLMHDRSLSEAGRGWSESVGGTPYDAAEYQRRQQQRAEENKLPWDEREQLFRSRGWQQASISAIDPATDCLLGYRG